MILIKSVFVLYFETTKMLIFEVCFILYYLNLSGKTGFWNKTTISQPNQRKKEQYTR